MPPVRKFMLCTGECVPGERLPEFPASHIIGELRYVTAETRRVSALAVYEQSVCTQAIPFALPSLRAELIGSARKIKCTCCIHRVRWEAGKAAMDAIIENARRNGVA